MSEKEKAEEEKILTEEFHPILLLFDTVNSLMVALICVVLILTFAIRQVTVSGESMTNTLQDGDRLFITNFAYTPQYGDIVIISHGEHYAEPIIKRVIATEGQALKINYDTGEVSVDGVVLDEPYIKGTTCKIDDSLNIPDKIPEGYIFVMGDNREGSLDSRSKTIGLIPVDNILGKAQIRIYPMEKFGSVYENMK